MATKKNREETKVTKMVDYYRNILQEKVPEILEGKTMDETISSGFILYDEIIGGIPKGRIVNIASEPGCGKTTLLVQLAQNLIKLQEKNENVFVVYIDTEGSMSYRRFKELGLDLDKLLYLQPKTLEMQYTTILTILKEKKEINDNSSIIFCFDSITATPTQQELQSLDNDEVINQQIGFRARVNSKVMPVLVSQLNQTNSTLIMVNQLRKNIQMGFNSFGPQEEIVGGLSLLYYSSQDIRLTVKSSFKNLFENWDILGKVVYFKAKKNRLMSPLIEFPMVLDYTKGFDDVLSQFVFLQDLNKQDYKQVNLENTFYTSGPYYKIVDIQTQKEYSFKSSEFVDRYNQDPEFQKAVKRLVITIIRRLYKGYPDNYIWSPESEHDTGTRV